jgi:hypothetical protein
MGDKFRIEGSVLAYFVNWIAFVRDFLFAEFCFSVCAVFNSICIGGPVTVAGWFLLAINNLKLLQNPSPSEIFSRQ